MKLDPTTWRIAIRQADMLVRRARDRAEKRHAYKRGGGLKPSGEEIVRVLCDLADEVWALAETPPAIRDAAYEFDRKVEAEWHEGEAAATPRRAGSS